MTVRAERGLTVVELLVAVTISALIAGVLTSAIATGLRTTEQTRDRVQQTQDAHLIGASFVSDVQSAETVSLDETSCAGADPLVHLAWTDDGTDHAAAYVARTVAGERVLTRYACVGAGAPTRRDLGHALHATTDPSVACAPVACGAGPDRVSMTVTEADGWSYTLTGTRRSA